MRKALAMMTTLILLLTFVTPVLSVTSSSVESTQTLSYLGQDITILRDNFGVPHVYADTDAALFFGAGYATAQDRLWQAELSRIVSSGRMAELTGKDSDLAQDEVIRRDGYTDEELMQQFNSLPEYAKTGLNSYIAGINYYIEAVPLSQLPLEFQGVKPRPWQITDSLRVSQLMVRRFGEAGGLETQYTSLLLALQSKFGPEKGLQMFNTLYWKNDSGSPVSVPVDGLSSVPPAKATGKSSFPNLNKLASQLENEANMKLEIEKEFGFPHKGGSNAWVVSPKRSESGSALLLGGPQMGYSVPQIAHEIGIHGAGYNTVGMAFAGAGPIPLIGRGNDFAWTTTTGGGDQIDTYLLMINPSNPNQYFHNGQWQDFETRTEVINVRGQGPMQYTFYRSVYGPVVYKDQSVAYTQKRSHWAQEIKTFIGFWDFNRSHNINQFAQAVQEIATSHNFLYIDKQGNIGYWLSGRAPIRPNNLDGRFIMQGDGSQDWTGIIPPKDLAHIVNPDQGYVANWNNKPRVDWDNTEWPFGQIHRVKFIQDQLAADESISFADMEKINRLTGTVDLDAYYFKALLVNSMASKNLTPELQAAVEAVEDWDGYRTDSDHGGYYDNPGMTIFQVWLQNLQDAVFAELDGISSGSRELLYSILLGQEASLQPQYDFLHGSSQDEVIQSALAKAVQTLSSGDKPMDQWLTKTKYINFQKIGAGLVEPIEYLNRGTYNQIVELSNKKDISVNILPPGQSGDPRSPHFDDQRLLYANWRYKPLVLSLR